MKSIFLLSLNKLKKILAFIDRDDKMIIALNNKCNFKIEEFLTYQQELNKIADNNLIVLCPTSLYLSVAKLDNIKLGAQNTSCTKEGAYTGEISASQLKSLNVEYCIVGHSERRKNQKESNEEIKEKITRLLEENITPILCVGETKEEREKKQVEQILKEELEILNDINDKERIIIAYEPIWSIGTGLIPSNTEIKEVINLIKTNYPSNKVLYGGSANEKNIDELKKIREIDGYLIGGMSLHPEKIQEFLQKLKK